MALPTFAKSGISTVTFEREEALPVNEDYERRSISHLTDMNTIYVVYRANRTRIITITFKKQSATLLAALLTFLRHTNINWSQSSFVYTDSSSVAHTVYYVDKQQFEYQEGMNTRYNITLILKEINF